MIVEEIRSEIDLLWLTGELRLEKPTVAQEVAWGLHFFEHSLFNVVWLLHDDLERALEAHYPGERFELPPFFVFGCWIGGDRDGNPNVTNTVTRHAVQEYRMASLRRYGRRSTELSSALSIAERTLEVSSTFRAALDQALAESGAAERIAARNPGEVFRQFLSCMQRKLDATTARATGAAVAAHAPQYRTAEELLADVKVLERGLCESASGNLAAMFVTPLRREVDAFRFAPCDSTCASTPSSCRQR